MGKYAPVAPYPLLKDLASRQALERYHLLLAHEVAAHPYEYNSVIPGDSFIIMDNSVVELGAPVSWDIMSRAIRTFEACQMAVVLPDVMLDSAQTVAMSRQAANIWMLPPNSCYMAVPQGRTFDEVVNCARALAGIPGVGYLAVPKCVGDLVGGRSQLVEALSNIQLPIPIPGAHIHLLGFTDNLEDDMRCCRMDAVMGIDSAVPIRMGMAGHYMHLEMKGDYAGRRGTFWQDYSAPTSRLTRQALQNVHMIRTWASRTYGL